MEDKIASRISFSTAIIMKYERNYQRGGKQAFRGFGVLMQTLLFKKGVSNFSLFFLRKLSIF